MSRLNALPSWDLPATWATFENDAFHTDHNGIELQKTLDDLDRYRELIEISQPDIVVETGTRAGGSAAWFRDEMNLRVVTIDVVPPSRRGSGPISLVGSAPGLTVVTGSSIDPNVRDAVLPLLDGKRVMVSLDADHHSVHVQAEIALWAGLVSPGCYMVVEDACFDLFDRAGFPQHARIGGAKIPEYGGALDAIERTLAMPTHLSSLFWRDEALEGRTPVSHSPAGWWRRHG